MPKKTHIIELSVKQQTIDAISEYHEYLTIQAHQIPIAKRSKEEVVKRLKVI